jgi:hypothetical protein
MNPLFLLRQKIILSEMAISHCLDSKYELWEKISQMVEALILKEAFFYKLVISRHFYSCKWQKFAIVIILKIAISNRIFLQ